MGGADFFRIRAPSGKTIAEMAPRVTLITLSGERVAIDASFFIFNAVAAALHTGGLSDASGKTTVHLNTNFNRIIQLASDRIEQFWAFDSPEPNPLKAKTQEERRARREKAKAAGKPTYQISAEHITDVQALLRAMGITYATAPAGIEAEQYAAMLTMGEPGERLCRYAISGDSDVVLFGGNLLRVVSAGPKGARRTEYYGYDAAKVYEMFNLSRTRFVEMAVALGTDFNDRLYGCGPLTVYQKYVNDKISYDKEHSNAVDYFTTVAADQLTKAEIVESTYNRQAVLDLLVPRGFAKDRLEKRLDTYEKALARMRPVAGEGDSNGTTDDGKES